MAARVLIVGHLPNRPARSDVLDPLRGIEPSIDWEWYQPVGDGFNLEQKHSYRLLHELRTAKPGAIAVVKLKLLNGKDQDKLYAVYSDPILAPAVSSAQELVEWLTSSDAGLVNHQRTILPVREAALLAVLSKLVRNKSWNKDTQGHAWTKEMDLLQQAPVSRPKHPALYGQANVLLGRLAGNLLLTKGSDQGATPREWSINTGFLPSVKQCLIGRSLAPLRQMAALGSQMRFVDDGPAETVEIDKTIISERILAICRAR